MGVYNPNAIMPKNCAVCHEECKYRNITAHKRHKRCPLVEVKTPHGRLIDEDAFSDMWSGNHIGDEDENRYHDAQWIYRDEVDKVSTVIEAEVE